MSDEIPDFRVNGWLSSANDVLRKPESDLAEFAWHFANEASEAHSQAAVRCHDERGRSYPLPRRLEVHPHYQKKIDEAKAELEKLEAITPRTPRDMSRLNAAAGEWYANAKAARAQFVELREREAARGQRMIDTVDAWVAPSALLDLKLAMRKALVLTGEARRGPPLHELSMPANLLDWHEERLGRAHASLARAIKELADEKEKIESLNVWLEAMHTAFGEPVPYETS